MLDDCLRGAREPHMLKHAGVAAEHGPRPAAQFACTPEASPRSSRHPEVPGAKRRASKGAAPGRSSFEARALWRFCRVARLHHARAPQDDGRKAVEYNETKSYLTNSLVQSLPSLRSTSMLSPMVL